MGSTSAVDIVAETRFGWWSQAHFNFNGRVLVYHKKQTDDEKAARIPPVEVKVTGVTTDPDRIGYKWKDWVSVGELEATFVRLEDPRWIPPIPPDPSKEAAEARQSPQKGKAARRRTGGSPFS